MQFRDRTWKIVVQFRDQTLKILVKLSNRKLKKSNTAQRNVRIQTISEVSNN